MSYFFWDLLCRSGAALLLNLPFSFFLLGFTVGGFDRIGSRNGCFASSHRLVLRWLSLTWSGGCNAMQSDARPRPRRVTFLGSYCVTVSDAPSQFPRLFAAVCAMVHDAEHTGSCCGWGGEMGLLCCPCVLWLSLSRAGRGPGKNGGSLVCSECGCDRPHSARRPLSASRQPLTILST